MERRASIHNMLTGPVPDAAKMLGEAIEDHFPGCAVLLYGSGISTLAQASPEDVLYDFYVITPSYRSAFDGLALRAAGRLLPPNVFYLEKQTALGLCRCKYAVLSLDHFRSLVSEATFHSYFWARFAQPSRLVSGNDEMSGAIETAIEAAIDTFTARAQPLCDGTIESLWLEGLRASYKAELRAEQPGRAQKLLKSYGDWPHDVTTLEKVAPANLSRQSAEFAWFIRRVQGAFLSVARLLKGIFTFDGGMDYIAWKISRHAGFTLTVKPWERRWPLLGFLPLAIRYYRLKARHKH